MKMRWFVVVISFAFCVLRVLSIVFIEVDEFINGSTDLLLVLITAVYAYSTNKIVQASKDQTDELKNQNAQLEKQHEEIMRVQKYERRIAVQRLLVESEYKKIDTYDLKYMFNDNIFQDVRRLDFLYDQFVTSYNEISKFVERFDAKTYSVKHFRDVFSIIKSFTLKPGLKEVANKVFEEILELQPTEKGVADYLRSELDSLISQKQEIDTIKSRAISNIEDIVKQR